MKNLLIISAILLCNFSEAQNLVSNGDFETQIGCPNNVSQLDSALDWFNPCSSSGGTPDYFSACSVSTLASTPNNLSGFQYPHSGISYGGIILGVNPGYREYLEGHLISSLVVGVNYNFEMYVNLGNNSQYSSDAIGVYFSDTAITGIGNFLPLQFSPQIINSNGNFDTSSWKLVSGSYTAVGGEDYLIIGNFNDDSHTNYVLDNASASIPGIYCYVDDVRLTLATSAVEIISEDEHFAYLYPNPTTDVINISVRNSNFLEISFFDMSLRNFFTKVIKPIDSISLTDYSDGVFFYEIRNDNEIIKRGRIIKK